MGCCCGWIGFGREDEDLLVVVCGVARLIARLVNFFPVWVDLVANGLARRFAWRSIGGEVVLDFSGCGWLVLVMVLCGLMGVVLVG